MYATCHASRRLPFLLIYHVILKVDLTLVSLSHRQIDARPPDETRDDNSPLLALSFRMLPQQSDKRVERRRKLATFDLLVFADVARKSFTHRPPKNT